MKTVETTLRNHLDGDVTALCTCWKITRRDGVKFLFTDADEDVVVDGESYRAVGAYQRSAIESTATMSVDNLEVVGMSNEVILPIAELRSGAFDHAEVLVFVTSWMDVYAGKIRLRRGFFGEVQTLPNNTFTVELRGLSQRLAHSYTDIYSALCRNDLGDSNCGVDLSHPFRSQGAQLPLGFDDFGFEDLGSRGLGAISSWYDPTASGQQLTTTSPTYSGTYAACGAVDGFLRQDLALATKGREFQEHVDSGAVDFKLHGWRRDTGGRGEIRVSFRDDRQREVRQSGYISINRGYVQLPEQLNVIGGDDFTMEYWINAAEYRQANAMMLRIATTLSNGNAGRIDLMNDSSLFLGPDEEPALRLYIRDLDGGASIFYVLPEKFVDEGWVHIALKRDGEIFTIYKNARVFISVDLSTVGDVDSTDFSNMTLHINQIFGGTSNRDFIYDMDELRIWDYARTQQELAANRFHDLPDNTSGLRHYWPFDDGLGDSGYEDSGNLYLSSTGSSNLNGSTDTPVRVAYRGNVTDVTTGLVSVGDEWVLTEISGQVPPKTVYMRIDFEAFPGTSGEAESGVLLDSLFGFFIDSAAGVNEVPNLDEAADDTHWTRAGIALSSGDTRVFKVNINESRAINGWFNGGLVTFYTGKNAGRSMEVKRWSADSNVIELYLSLPYPIEQGDLFTVYPGCDKSRICCTLLYDNIRNMFATPDVPGEDAMMTYPDAH
ncbi:minor tail protein [Ruegeria phage RpAliso]|nr:minor tail protein [Ruegeria phage RpAliso]